MSVGNQASSEAVSQQLTQYSLGMRGLMAQISNLNLFVNGGGTGLAFLESLGYNSADAAAALEFLSYLNTVAGVYYGNVQQGGSGGTGAIEFNFENATAPLWAAQ